MVTTLSGFTAGLICAFGSHPMDTMVSKVYARDTIGKKLPVVLKEIYAEIGFRGLWKGLT